MTADLTRLQAIADAASPGKWELGDVWCWAGTGFLGRDDDTCTLCESLGDPVWVGMADINGKRMKAHKHRDPDPYEPDHLISSQDGLVAGNYDYESGGIIAANDAELIVAMRNTLPALLAVVETAEALGKAQRRMLDDWAEDGDGPFTRTRTELWRELHRAGDALDDALAALGAVQEAR